jgi:hypothetical protein
MTKEIENLIANLQDDDVSNATQACRELEERLRNEDYSSYHSKIKNELNDAYEKWGDKNCNNWAGAID